MRGRAIKKERKQVTQMKAATQAALTGAVWLLGIVILQAVVIGQLQAPAPVSVSALIAGFVIWGYLGFIQATKDLKKLEQPDTGKLLHEVSLRRMLQYTFAALLAGVGVILLGFYIAYYQPFWTFLVNLVVPFQSGIGFASAVCFWRWQHKNNRALYIVNKKLSLTPT
jgi:hypothetical protein